MIRGLEPAREPVLARAQLRGLGGDAIRSCEHVLALSAGGPMSCFLPVKRFSISRLSKRTMRSCAYSTGVESLATSVMPMSVNLILRDDGGVTTPGPET